MNKLLLATIFAGLITQLVGLIRQVLKAVEGKSDGGSSSSPSYWSDSQNVGSEGPPVREAGDRLPYDEATGRKSGVARRRPTQDRETSEGLEQK